MSTTLPEADLSHEADEPRPLADATMLEDKLPDWFQTRPAVLLFAVAVGISLLFFNTVPLAPTDIWGHLSYGRHLWQTGELPQTEPLMPLARGIRFVDTAWLAQLGGYGLYQAGGAAALRFAYGFAITLAMALLLHAVWHRTRDVLASGMAGTLFIVAAWKQLLIIRPQLLGVVAFCWLLHRLSRRPSRHDLWSVPLVFLLWANLHGSFVMGVAVLGAFCVGQAVDVWRRSGSLRMAVAGRVFRHRLLLLELGVLATLLNPYGLMIYAEVLTFASHPNLANLIEWDPLTLRMVQGRAAAGVALLLVLLYRCTPRRITAVEVLTVVGLGAAALWTSRMIQWWAPVAAYFAAIHLNAAWKSSRAYRRWFRLNRQELLEARFSTASPDRGSLWSVTSLGVLFICVSLTPLAMQMKTRKMQDFNNMVSRSTPVAAVEHLKQMEDRPDGLVFNTYEWGDYLMWTAPEMKVFVASHVHLIPTEVWGHYLQASSGSGAVHGILGRYGVNTVIADLNGRADMISELRESAEWKEAYLDDRATIFIRRDPID